MLLISRVFWLISLLILVPQFQIRPSCLLVFPVLVLLLL